MEAGAGGDRVAADAAAPAPWSATATTSGCSGCTPDTQAAPDTLPLDRRELTEENFDEAYAALVGQYDKTVPTAGLSATLDRQKTARRDRLGVGARTAVPERERGTPSSTHSAGRTRRAADAAAAETIAASLHADPRLQRQLALLGPRGSTQDLRRRRSSSDVGQIGAEIACTYRQPGTRIRQGHVAPRRRPTSAAPTTGCCRTTSPRTS